VTQIGEGGIPVRGSLVQVHYVAWLEQGGSAVDSSRDRNDGKPVEFILGNGDVLRGVDQVVSTMQVGEICHAILPPAVAYGEEGWPPCVPPNATIKMDLELLDFIDPEKLKAGAETAEASKAERLKGKKIDLEECIPRAMDIKAEGNTFFQKGQHVAAAKKYRQGIALFEQRRGRCLVEGEDLDRAKPLMVPLHLNLAACQLEMKDYKMAIRNCRRVIELDESNVKAHFRCAKALWEQGSAAEAQKEIHQITPENRTTEVQKFGNKIDKYIKQQTEKERAVYQKMF